MTPRSFLHGFRGGLLRSADREERLRIGEAGTIGVVLMGLGGPSSESDIEPYLFRLLMDPLRVRFRFAPHWLRERAARFLACRRAPHLSAALRSVGGVAPEIRLLTEQARALEIELGRFFEGADDITVRAYMITRYGSDDVAATIARMRADGVTHVVLVPASPVRLSAVTDTCVAWWQMAAREAEFDHVPATVVWAQGEHESVVQSAGDRIDEALQRFPRPLRDDVHVVFALHPAAALDSPDGTPERSPLGRLVQQICHSWSPRRHRHIAYVQNWGLNRQPSPVMVEKLQAVAAAGGTGVVIAPVGFTTETMETAYELDVVLRGVAETCGMRQIEIAAGLNCHALYVRALAEIVRDRLYVNTLQGDGTLLPLPVPPNVVETNGDAV